MRQPKRWVAITMALGIVATLWSATVVVAGGPPAPPTVAGNGASVNRVKTVSSVESQETGSETFVDLVGASRSFQLSQTSLIVARFTAESTCFNPEQKKAGPQGPSGPNGFEEPPGLCRIRIIATKQQNAPLLVELNPASGSNYSFDTPDNSNECSGGCEFEGHAVKRSATLDPGTWVIQVQYAASGFFFGPDGCCPPPSSLFVLDDWHLTVERWLIS